MKKFLMCILGTIAATSVVTAQSPVQNAAVETTPNAGNKLMLVGGCAGGCGVAPSMPVIAAPLAGASCGCDTSAPKVGLLHRALAPVTIGAGCASDVGCSNCAQERTFMFGSCRQFFNPGKDCNACGNKPFGTVFGPGNLGNYNLCTYGSYLNR